MVNITATCITDHPGNAIQPTELARAELQNHGRPKMVLGTWETHKYMKKAGGDSVGILEN
jgi:hypothetical protein